MLFSPCVPTHPAHLRHARWLGPLALTIAMVGGACAALAQTSAAAEEAIKKAIQSGQLDQARELVRKERKDAPQAVQWRFMEGVIQAQQGQIDKAIETFQHITQTHPEHSEAYNNLGVLYASKGQLETSKAFLEKALQTHPSYAAAHRNLSDVHSHLAKQSYGKALQLNPKAKSSAPQLTLLGSMGLEPRGQPPALNQAALSPPAAPTPSQVTSQITNQKPAPALSATPAAAPAGSAGKVPPQVPASAPTASATPPRAATESATKPSPSVVETPAASASASPPSAKPAADARQAERTAIEKAVQDWAQAWSSKDMARYYAAYASNFTPANRATRAQWESDRRNRIESKKSISVDVREMRITVQGETASVRFQQLYSSDNLKSSGRKTLDMVRQGERWLIVRESTN